MGGLSLNLSLSSLPDVEAAAELPAGGTEGKGESLGLHTQPAAATDRLAEAGEHVSPGRGTDLIWALYPAATWHDFAERKDTIIQGVKWCRTDFVFHFKIRMLEKLRLSAWKKNPVNAEKDKESPKILENNGSSVPKGVKFAVSMFILCVTDYIMYVYGMDE